MVAAFVIGMALAWVDGLLFNEKSPVGIALATVIIFGTIAALTWFFWFWRPLCPQCRNARAKFTYSDRRREHLTCPSCGFEEPTGWERGGVQ
jgi:hypothetical protein